MDNESVRAQEDRIKLIAGFEAALKLIKRWREYAGGDPPTWQAYLDRASEMEPLRQALRAIESGR